MLTRYKGYIIEISDKGKGFTTSSIYNKLNYLCGITVSSAIGEQSIDKAKKRIDHQILDKSIIIDHLNPVLIFDKVDPMLLSQIVKGEIDAKKLAELELFDRGYDMNGNKIP